MKRSDNQTSLFDSIEVMLPSLLSSSLSTSIEWSYSRRDLFERCLRWYYYTYYGAAAKMAPTDPMKPQLKRLKKLSNRYLRAGELLHLIIRTYIKKYKGGEEWSTDRTVNWAVEMYKKDLERSISYQKTGLDQDKNDQSVLLAEFFFNQPDAETLWLESLQRLKRALQTFLTHPKLDSFRRNSFLPGARVEETIHLKETGLRVRGQIDLAWTEGDKTKVIDWKIGDSNSADDSLQLLSYALLISSKYGYSPNAIEIYKVYLGNAEITPFLANESEVHRARMRIIQDVQRMQSMEWYGKNGIVEAFTPCGQEKICGMCPFQQVCPKE
jgi:hypothetical protein